MQLLLRRGGGLINKVKISVQELGSRGQRGEGAYFRENMVICDRIWENPAYREFQEFLIIAIYLTSSTMELTCVEVSDRLRTSLRSYSALFAIMPQPQ